ncbi:MAG: hypothetical protein ACXQTE_03645 [Methanosarcinaceae archaeon]
MGCVFCGKRCSEYDIEGGDEEEIAEGRIIGTTHICMDCVTELKEILGIYNLDKEVAEVEYELFEEIHNK